MERLEAPLGCSRRFCIVVDCKGGIERNYIREAAEYSNIGINKIDSMLKQPNCPFVLYLGTRKLVKRKEFEEYISGRLVI